MLAKGLFWVGKLLSLVVSVLAFALVGVTWALTEPLGSASGPVVSVAFLVLPWVGWPAAVVVHECGHLLACLAFRVRVYEFRIALPNRAVRVFAVRGVTVALGMPYAGQVLHGPVASRWRAAVITGAGSLANLAVAGVLLAAGLATSPALSWPVPVHLGIEGSVAALFAATGISNLLPYRTRLGRLSDGGKLLALASVRLARALGPDGVTLKGPEGAIWRPVSTEEAAEYQRDSAALKQIGEDSGVRLPPELLDKWLAAYRDRTFIGLVTAWAVGRTLRKEGRVDELVQLLVEYPEPQGTLAPAMTRSVSCLAYEVALLPGMPPDVVDMAADWLQRVTDDRASMAAWGDLAAAGTAHSMAVARLRQGKFDVVEQLCQQWLAIRELPPGDRATVLATVALARQALGQPYEALLAEATALDPDADLVAEASARSAAAGT